MVKLFALMVLYKGEETAHVLRDAYDVSSFGYFQQKSVKEFMEFSSKVLGERTGLGERQSVKEGEYMVHAYASASTSLVGIAFTCQEYQQRVAHNLLTKILEDFAAQVPRSQWPVDAKVNGFGEIDVMLQKYQKPEEADPMTKVQNELDETKIILHNTIEAVLNRGEKLDDLVYKSEGLSLQSKTFYKTARKTNSCCGSWS